MYAVGYFTEVGIGTEPDLRECVPFSSLFTHVLTNPYPYITRRAIKWYKRASDMGDKRASARLKSSKGPATSPGSRNSVSVLNRDESDVGSGKGGKDKDCIIM